MDIKDLINYLKDQKKDDEKLYDKYSTLTLKDYNQVLKCYHEGRIEVEEDVLGKLEECVSLQDQVDALIKENADLKSKLSRLNDSYDSLYEEYLENEYKMK